jgi:hypothetical protein
MGMIRIPRVLAAIAGLALAATAAAAAEPLKPVWSRPVGGSARFVGVEEYGRCSVFVDNGVLQVVSPSGAVAWTWPFAQINKHIYPARVAVSPQCDAIAFGGDAGYKYAWVVQRGGTSAALPFVGTPADVAFDHAGRFVAVGTFGASMFLYTRSGELQWTRKTDASIVSALEFTDDDQHIVFKGWGGVGVISAAGLVEWSKLASRLAAARNLSTFVIGDEPNHGPGLPGITATDDRGRLGWFRWGGIDAFVSANGDRILAVVDRNQAKNEQDFYGAEQEREVQLLARDGSVVKAFPDYHSVHALADDGTRLWLGVDRLRVLSCVDAEVYVLATIATISVRDVSISRDFSQVLVVNERDFHAVSVDRYDVPRPCRR